ncbi:MAG: hypothetical protein WAK55_34215 [Xanthobacteraceae bacterium]
MNTDTQSDDKTIRLLGGLYISLAYAMPDTNNQVAHDILTLPTIGIFAPRIAALIV